MNLGLTNRVALIGGSSRGIGLAIAEKLLAEGCRVCVTGRDEECLSRAVRGLTDKFGQSVIAFRGDLAEVEAIEGALATIRERWGGLDLVIANLGTGAGKVGWDVDQNEWDRLFQVNFWGSVHLAHAAIPDLIERGQGCIVFIASIAGLEAIAAPLPYCAAKAALINYGKNLARTVAPHGIRVNCVAPGNTLFPGGTWEKHLAHRREEVMRYIDAEVPLRRFGDPAEIADMVAFLCSQRAAFISGACMVVDGGQSRSV